MSARRFVAGLCAVVGVLMVTSASALASPPESPGVVTAGPIEAHSVVLHGVLNPNAEGEAGTYEFLYKTSASECQGANTARGLAFGLSAEEVSQEVTGLTPNTEYAVCLLARTLGGETSMGPVATFKTAGTLEAPVAEAPTEVTTDTAVLSGKLNPSGPGPNSSYYFLYAASPTTCQGGIATAIGFGSGLEQQAVSQEVRSLTANTTYTFCVVVEANGETVRSAPFTFTTTSTAPVLSKVSASNVGALEATLTAQMEPTGVDTSYYAEYGPSLPYAFSTPEQQTYSTNPVELRVPVSNLQPGVIYHFRLVASNTQGTVQSADYTFSTHSAGISSLPDGRVYELVTPPDGSDTEVYPPGSNGQIADYTEFPYQAAVDGDAVAFPAGPTVGGSEDSGWHGGNQYLATRNPGGGWSEVNLSPAQPSAEFQAFNGDLSEAFLDADEPVVPSAPGYGEGPEGSESYDVLYSGNTKTAEYEPFFTAKPPYREPSALATVGEIFLPNNPTSGGHRGFRTMAFAGASADDSHLLFLANDALTAASEGRPAAEGGTAASFANANNLYEWFDGSLRLVNVLPDDSTHVKATFGGGPLFNRVISTDGSRIFWTDLSTGHIYLRENGTTTTEVSSAGKFQTASSDGSVAFYTDGDLYRYEVGGGVTSDLDPGVSVKRVLGASEDGRYVYFYTEAGEIDLWHEGEVTTISSFVHLSGPAEVTPDGHAVVFHELETETFTEALETVKVYEAATNDLYCVSCVSGESKKQFRAVLESTNKANVYQPRWITADGAHVFFDSQEPLVSEDSNGTLDVYEWTEPGASGCAEDAGCLHLLTGGTSSGTSYFADASVSGSDVFVVTRAKLVRADDNELFDIYDLRVDGYRPIVPPACTGTGCQGVPGAPPIFATPSSVTFEGVGNFSAGESKPPVKPKKAHKNKKKKQAKKQKRKSKAKAKKGVRSAASRKKGGRS